jgi:hypothetical protein
MGANGFDSNTRVVSRLISKITAKVRQLFSTPSLELAA